MMVECVDIGNRTQPTCLRPDCYYQGYLFTGDLGRGMDVIAIE